MIASGTSYRPASSSARNNILSWRPQASQVRIGSFARSIPFVFHRSLYSSLVCPTANNSVRIIVRQTWQLHPREGGEEAHCARKKSSGNFEDPPPKTLARDLLTNAKFIYDLTVHIRGSHGQDLSFSGAAVDSIVDTWVNGGVVIVRNLEEWMFWFPWMRRVPLSERAPLRFPLRFSSWPRSPPTFGPAIVYGPLLLCFFLRRSKRKEIARTRIENVIPLLCRWIITWPDRSSPLMDFIISIF